MKKPNLLLDSAFDERLIIERYSKIAANAFHRVSLACRSDVKVPFQKYLPDIFL
jgi:hypothetical protein